ncbi:CC0125/CC1285 family lipoprotein [Kangiella shandongensis]|uniref:CC0125/CC1285 family lipoprotein n=1 Tax=Kangiella shandongensis TaxID=2763258 RepID=UPI001CBB4927|nr:hypothetical protein [Kangiella shandongensis]
MKNTLLIFIMIVLGGCATQYRYNPTTATGSGPYHAQVNDNLYRVHYKLLKDDQKQARQLALQHAAKLTRQQQLDWFVVLRQQMITEQPINSSSDKIIRLTCDNGQCQQSSYDNPYFRQQFKESTPTVTTEAILQIRMGRGMRPHGAKSFDAYQQ